jgi:DNA-binding CsgD family transcriptional regulator
MSQPNAHNTSLLYKIDFLPRYWESLRSGILTDMQEESWKRKIEFLDNFSLNHNAVLFLWNAYTNRYIYISAKLEELAGLDPELFLTENGIEYSLSRIHPDHIGPLLQFNQTMVNYNMATDVANIYTGLNYLYKNGREEYEQVLQRGVALEHDNYGKPSLVLNIINYIGHIKKRNSLNGTIISNNEVILLSYNVEKGIMESPKTISEQEKKIIKLLAQGQDTREIAHKLNITEQTVYTHRRNLIRKTECIDATGVVAFAKLINLI